MSTISYGTLAASKVITTPGTIEEWFSVPTSHEYIGAVRVSHVGAVASGSMTYSLIVLPATGTTPEDKNYHAKNVDLYEKDVHDFTVELGPGETIAIDASSVNVAFNFTGLDKDNS